MVGIDPLGIDPPVPVCRSASGAGSSEERALAADPLAPALFALAFALAVCARAALQSGGHPGVDPTADVTVLHRGGLVFADRSGGTPLGEEGGSAEKG